MKAGGGEGGAGPAGPGGWGAAPGGGGGGGGGHRLSERGLWVRKFDNCPRDKPAEAALCVQDWSWGRA